MRLMSEDRLTIEFPTAPLRPATAAFVRPLELRYLGVLLSVALLVVVDQAIIQPSLVDLNLYAPAINLAGRQRMLSQKISKGSLVMASQAAQNSDSRESNTAQLLIQRRAALRSDVQQWRAAHETLMQGDATTGIEPLASPQVRGKMLAVSSRLDSIAAAAESIADPTTTDDERQRRLGIVLTDEPKFLSGMEQVVTLLAEDSREQVNFLRACGLAAMLTILGLIAGVYFVALRPATRLIRKQIAALDAAHNELEARVVARTNALSIANAALTLEIAERHRAESRTRELADQFAHASRVTALGQLATGLAHEINQPLASIASYADTADLLLANPIPQIVAARDAIVQIRTAALRGGTIVRRMRNFVKRGEVRPQPIEINELVREVRDLCRPQLDQAGAALSLEFHPGSIVAAADPLEIQQVLVNLVQNAAQAVQERPREHRQIVIRTRSVEGEVWLEVADSGPGFVGHSAEECFSAFYSTKGDGLGLGLAVCRTLLARYQGRIWAEDTAAAGATIVFSLPMQSTHDVKPSDTGHCVCG
jgi:signal transduction histidine kinase